MEVWRREDAMTNGRTIKTVDNYYKCCMSCVSVYTDKNNKRTLEDVTDGEAGEGLL